MTKCKGCYLNKENHDLVNGKCSSCRGVKPKDIRATPITHLELDKIVLTTETVSPVEVESRLGIVTSECVIGLNIFKDFFSSIRDVVGGRNKGFQQGLKEAKELVLEELKKEVILLGGDYAVAVDIKYSEISGGGKSMLFVVATGTAIKTVKK